MTITKIKRQLNKVNEQLRKMPELWAKQEELYARLFEAKESQGVKWEAKHKNPTVPQGTLRILAYKEEFASDHEWVEGLNNYFVIFNGNKDEWDVHCHNNIRVPGIVYFPYGAAYDLMRKLNDEEVEL